MGLMGIFVVSLLHCELINLDFGLCISLVI